MDNPTTEVPVHPNEIYAGELQEERIRNLISQTSPDNQVEEIEWRIKGYKRDTYTRQWKKIDDNLKEPPAELIVNYISYLASLLNENTRLTNLSSAEINALMKIVIHWIRDDLQVNGRKEYGLDYTQMTKIGHIILNETFMVLKRAQNGMESQRIFKALSLNENINAGMPKKAGMLDTFKFWKP